MFGLAWRGDHDYVYPNNLETVTHIMRHSARKQMGGGAPAAGPGAEARGPAETRGHAEALRERGGANTPAAQAATWDYCKGRVVLREC